jgi:transcriptional regulator with XRE-family HTH domain
MAKGLPILRQIREAQGITQRALAARAGITQAALFRLESGETDPRLSTLRKLAKALNVTVADLIGEGKSRRGGTGRR